MHRIFLVVLINQFVFCDSRIHIFVYTAPTKKEVLVNYYGVDNKIVTTLEEKLFNITDENLKKGVNIELGKEPDDVFLKGPTKYGNLHEIYNWMPVMRSLQVKRAEIIDVISDRVVVKSHEHINNTTETIKSNALISEIVESAISSFWSEGGLPEDEIYFDIDYSFNGRAVMYHNRWRHDNFQSASLPFGVKKNGYINIKPGQRATSKLKGSKTIILIKIYYVASLIGQVALNYAHEYGKYHFWAPKVYDIMKAAGLKNEIVTTELIEVRCYTQPELEIFDSDTKKPLKVVLFPTPFVVKPKSKNTLELNKNNLNKNKNMFILLCLLSLALAEPPVGDNYYETARSGYDHTVHQQYLPPNPTVPSARASKSFNNLSNQYLPPSTRSISQEYGLPNSRGLSQKYGLPSHDTSMFRSGISQEYGTAIGRSSQHELPNFDLNQSIASTSLRTGVSQRYGAPSFRNSPSSLYGSPSLRSSLLTHYGSPQLRSSNEYTQQASTVRQYSFPNIRSTNSHLRSVAHEYDTPMNSDGFSLRSQSSVNPSETYGAPTYSSSTQHGISPARSSVTNFGGSTDSLKMTYEVPSSRSLNEDVRTLNFGRSNSKTKAFTPSYPSVRSPSLEYDTLSSRATVPSQEYGAPEGLLDDQGYENARNALETLNQEPANYEFAYKVSDDDTGSDFGHSETRQLDRAEGTYFVLLPDGTKQVVEYEADENGYKPRISVELVDSATALAAEGPY